MILKTYELENYAKMIKQKILTFNFSHDTIVAMKLNTYLKGKSRQDFADKIQTTIHYVNNLCQNPDLAGKKIIKRIIEATRGKVGFKDFT